MIKAIIFDCDGTLIDSEYAHFLSWQQALQKQGHNITLEEYYHFAGIPAEKIAKNFSKQLGSEAIQQLPHDKRTYYRSLQAEGHSPIQSTIDFLQKLSKKKQELNLRLGVASAARKDEIMCNLCHLGIDHLFDIILSGHEDLNDYQDPEGVNKPKPYIYLHAAKLLDLLPIECVVIEDSYTGVEAGISAGCVTIAIPNSFTKVQDFSHADIQLSSLTDVSIEKFLEIVETARKHKIF